MDKAEEFFQSKNGGKSSQLALEHGELISPIWAVELMEQYAQQVSRERAVKFIKDMDIKAEVELLQDHQYENMFDVWQQKQEEKKCSNCGSTNIGAWGPDADKCFDCEMTWDV